MLRRSPIPWNFIRISDQFEIIQNINIDTLFTSWAIILQPTTKKTLKLCAVRKHNLMNEIKSKFKVIYYILTSEFLVFTIFYCYSTQIKIIYLIVKWPSYYYILLTYVMSSINIIHFREIYYKLSVFSVWCIR